MEIEVEMEMMEQRERSTTFWSPVTWSHFLAACFSALIFYSLPLFFLICKIEGTVCETSSSSPNSSIPILSTAKETKSFRWLAMFRGLIPITMHLL
jgi:acyl carrier protein phosphodiesterase